MSRRPNSKSKRSKSWEDKESRDEKRDFKRDRQTKSKSTNDERWYGTDPALLRDAASIAFSWPIGQKFEYGQYLESIGAAPTTTKYHNIPGICVLNIAPTFGSGTDSDAINVASSQIYSFVRHTNAGHANYDPNDLMLYIMAMTEVYSYINFLERTYALATMYERKNRFTPDALLLANFIDPISIKNNLADFRYAINVLINKVSVMAVPSTMTIFERHAMLYSYVYRESNTTKDQLYMYNPWGFHRFELDDDSAGMLKFYPLPFHYGNLASWSDLIDYGEAMFNAIWDQEDFGIMSGDILKSYGDNILKLASLDEVVPYEPVFDPIVLHQIKNATVVLNVEAQSFDMKQSADKSRLEINVACAHPDTSSFALNEIVLRYNKVLSLDTEDPTPGMVMEATRLMAGVHSVDTSADRIEVLCGSEICMGARVITRYSPETQTLTEVGLNASVASNMSVNTVANIMAAQKAFKYAPTYLMVNFNSATDPTAVNSVYTSQEVDNFAIISNMDIEKMHTAAILNMLNVPSTAKFVR